MPRFMGLVGGMETQRIALRPGANRRGVQAGAGKSILTGKEKQHIRTETKPIVTCASVFENRARASREGVDEAVNKKLAAATAWPRAVRRGVRKHSDES